MSRRAITLDEARRAYVHRFTCDHVPAWAMRARPDGRFYAPHYASDSEWYGATIFPGERHLSRRSRHCQSDGQTWPHGTALDQPFKR